MSLLDSVDTTVSNVLSQTASSDAILASNRPGELVVLLELSGTADFRLLDGQGDVWSRKTKGQLELSTLTYRLGGLC